MTIRDFVNATAKDLHLYADGTSGDDANSGKSLAQPKKTLEAVLDLVPSVIKHNVAVHLSGVFEISTAISFNRIIETGYLVIDGGSELIAIDDNSGSNYSATAANTFEITDSSATWTVDEHAGYWVKVLTGPAANQVRRIVEHSEDTLYVSPVFSVSPGVGATFAIFRPATEIQAQGTNYCPITFSARGGELSISRLYLSGSRCYLVLQDCSLVRLRALISDSPCSGVHPFWFYGGSIATVSSNLLDPDTFSFDFTFMKPGISSRNATGRIRAEAITDTLLLYETYCAGQIWVYNCAFQLGYGLRSRGSVSIVDGFPVLNKGLLDYNSAYSRFEGGITIERSSLVIIPGSGSNGAIQIKNSASHGIELINSILDIQVTLAGSGNAGAGVYARNGSQVILKSGVVPTLTGAAGDIAVSDPTDADITWSQVDAGTGLQLVNKASVTKV